MQVHKFGMVKFWQTYSYKTFGKEMLYKWIDPARKLSFANQARLVKLFIAKL